MKISNQLLSFGDCDGLWNRLFHEGLPTIVSPLEDLLVQIPIVSDGVFPIKTSLAEAGFVPTCGPHHARFIQIAQ